MAKRHNNKKVVMTPDPNTRHMHVIYEKAMRGMFGAVAKLLPACFLNRASIDAVSKDILDETVDKIRPLLDENPRLMKDLESCKYAMSESEVYDRLHVKTFHDTVDDASGEFLDKLEAPAKYRDGNINDNPYEDVRNEAYIAISNYCMQYVWID